MGSPATESSFENRLRFAAGAACNALFGVAAIDSGNPGETEND
jgi:hypothetical protein